ncbi:ABC transporter ATP-binding protein/permease [Streptomyces sp. Je 1-4]|uniref:ABC transporter ATP-binding protein n=1 Tax=Streptomyces TaxID=1883 RepID=UPI0021D7DCBB|nr:MULTISPECIES: ABC transporter ATP-binding protein [unclassified Streptomyces]UYB39851.1 ABC transporter ATP-binding protein/permease [Streptomyces sp. Je 1-4]UZQ35911.1 ABC transporter ATP-binding protein/permease [Streptomyces sp. Je 1-4] [Streptomyces sp. Je 1-4 4N24]UZQ43329.1 ABC transporter ATP-binding protein/permease [Streptomyces sp. Je 1-4] [Streptomyces sp. Je 1-4 4N24_ara]
MADTAQTTTRTDRTDLPQRSAVRSLLRLWPFARPVRARLFTAAFVAVLASCVSLVIPLVLKWLVDGPVAERDPGGAWLGGAYLLLLGLAEALLFGLRRWLVARPLAGVEAAMREALYRHVQRLPVAFHDRWSSGQLLSRGTTDLQLLRMFLAFPLTFLLVNGVTILVGGVLLLAQRWSLGLVLLAPVLPLMVLCSVFEAKYGRAARRTQDQLGDLTTVVEESVLGIRVIKGFGRHRSQADAFRKLTRALRTSELRKARLLAWIWGCNTTLPELAIGAALVLGTFQVADGALSAGTLVAFLSTALALRWPVESIGFLLAMSNEAATATDRYFEVLDEPAVDAPAREAAADATAAVNTPPQDATAVNTPAQDTAAVDAPARAAPAPPGLVFSGVQFRYPDAPPDSPPLLRDITLHIRPGETMALVGATGSGKTTLTALVPRLYDPTAGRISLDGRDLATLGREEVRALVAVAFEEPTLFSATAAENVLMGGEGAQEGDFRRALEVAQADGFVDALPEGGATQVGEQGLSLSGGQRQRLALARAVVGRPRFLILDDPLSALDVHTEALVEAALRRVLSTTTALVVAHRPSTVLLADRVALLSGGRITAVGTHHELLRDHPEYATLMSGEGEGAR